MSTTYANQISGENFSEWYRERHWARNIREGRPYFNGPSPVPPSEKHSPSQLLQCHRKIVYRQENAPAEQETPEGIFWAGRRFEEDVIVPYLQNVVHGDRDAYVRNSMWVEFEAETDSGTILFKGVTDPCIVDRHSEPILPTEVKTKENIDHLDGPNRHHRAQAHAYMRGLSEKYDCNVDEALIIYGSRKTLDIRVFRVAFEDGFWGEVLKWAADHTAYREDGELPNADPEYEWECSFCDYRHRCGQSEEPYSDKGVKGLLPMYSEYPRNRVIEYLDAHEDAKLTPALASEYPDLATEYGCIEWSCPQCERTYGWDDVGEKTTASNPVCPECASEGELSVLTQTTE